MLGCVTVCGLLLGGICGCGLGLGLMLHWLVPAIDRGMATLCGLVATGGRPPGLWAAHDAHRTLGGGGGPLASLAAAAHVQADTRDPTPA
jgi:hypothetical protein